MGNFKIKNFKVGDIVYHLFHKEFRMIIVRLNNSRNELLCVWLDEDGEMQYLEMKPYDLGKVSDLNQNISA
ncbi:MAG: hypothetical protein J7J72_00255 [Bacteroidales bacterium]|nr:hypothetical protein [Bacteroidales bacterium]